MPSLCVCSGHTSGMKMDTHSQIFSLLSIHSLTSSPFIHSLPMAQNTPNTPSQPQQTEDPAWKSVSVTLISSDNGEFYVESLLLYAAR